MLDLHVLKSCIKNMTILTIISKNILCFPVRHLVQQLSNVNLLRFFFFFQQSTLDVVQY